MPPPARRRRPTGRSETANMYCLLHIHSLCRFWYLNLNFWQLPSYWLLWGSSRANNTEFNKLNIYTRTRNMSHKWVSIRTDRLIFQSRILSVRNLKTSYVVSTEKMCFCMPTQKQGGWPLLADRCKSKLISPTNLANQTYPIMKR